MKQAERREKRRRDILAAAMQDFASGYEGVTIDSLCARHGISKGAMYHYFSGRDALFLACVEEVFAHLRLYLEREMDGLAQLEASRAMRDYFLCREAYFRERPDEKGVFECALLRAPAHLREPIHALRAPLRELNREFMRHAIARLALRPGVRARDAERYAEAVEALFWEFFALCDAPQEADADPLRRMERLLGMLLFGIAAPPEAES